MADADSARVGDAFDAARNATIELFIAGVVVLAGLLGVQLWLARRTRRILNIPITVGSVAVLVCFVIGLVVLLTGQSAANRVRDTHYAATRALSQARIDAFDARANEGLTLVYQGSGADFEKAYQARMATAKANVDAATTAGAVNAGGSELDAYDTAHKQVRDARRQGRLDRGRGAGDRGLANRLHRVRRRERGRHCRTKRRRSPPACRTGTGCSSCSGGSP